ncbi:MAG: hypothetical protein AAF548_16920 [Actinomycetota bacterium]
MPLLRASDKQTPLLAEPGDPDRRAPWSMHLTWASLLLGSVIVSYAHSIASRASAGSQTHYHVFWLGIFTFIVPAAWQLLSRHTRDLDRYLLLVAVGVYSYFPKFLAYPGGPAFFDEYAHQVQTERLYDTGLLFMPNNQVVVIGDYPVMHSFAASIRHLTGLDTYSTAVGIIIVLHVLTMIGISAIATRITNSRHVGGIAALFYGIGPGFWGFNTMFAYESFAIVLFVWSCLALVHLQMSAPTAWQRTAWLITGILISFTLAGTHHLSSYANLIVVGSFVAASFINTIRKKEISVNFWESLIFFVVAFIFVAWWFLNQAPNTKEYLLPYVEGGLTETVGIFGDSGEVAEAGEEAGEQRELFAGSTIPLYEMILSFATPVLAAGIAGLSFLVQWKRGLQRTTALAMTITASVYFAVYPMMLSETGAEGARRSWSFTSAGLAVLAATGIQVVALWEKRGRRVIGTWAVIGTFMILMVGNLAVGMNEVYRFSGHFVYGSDTRSVTDDIYHAAEWLVDTQGTNQKTIGDRSSQIVLHDRAHVLLGIPDDAYPLWDFVIGEGPPGEDLLDRAEQEDLRFVVIDKRQIDDVPMIGFYLDQREPLATEREEPVSERSLTKWDDLDYALRIYESDEMIIYRLDSSAYDTTFRQVGNIDGDIGEEDAR